MYDHIKTPCFVIEKSKLDNAILLLKNSLKESWKNYIVGYSFKTNSLPWIVKYMKDNGFYAEVVSDDEYELSRLHGFDDGRIIYNGPLKSFETFTQAVENGAVVNIDSEREVDWVGSISEHCSVNIGIRVNFDIEKYCPGESACGDEGGRFGFCFENGEFERILKRLSDIDNVRIAGIHLHCSSKTRSLNIYKAIAEFACKIKEVYNLDLEYIDVGGGFFGGLDNKPKFPDYMKLIGEILSKSFDVEKTKLIVEPGMSIIGPSVDFVSSVIDVKTTSYNRFVVTDASRTNIDPLMTKSGYFKDIIFNGDSDRKELKRQVVCGFTCMEHDRLFVLENDKEILPGDKIVYHKVGAYTMCLNPLFIKYFPEVFLHDDDKFESVRKKWDAYAYSQYSNSSDGVKHD